MKHNLTIDQEFDGITVLFAPPLHEDHTVDILAVSGLGSHAFGSFVHKPSGHMWLSDSLPRDMRFARVMIYGYNSRLQDGASFARLDDLGKSLITSLRQLLTSEGQRSLVLVGHSLGGLLIKEALIQMYEDAALSDSLRIISGILFFGVPNDGMDIESLIPIVNDQPNRPLLESLSRIYPNALEEQQRQFGKLTEHWTTLNMYCFYETLQSPTAKKVGPISATGSRDDHINCRRCRTRLGNGR